MERNISMLISGRKLYEFARHLPVSWVGRIVAIAPGCKPGDSGLRRFESCPAHKIRSHVSYVTGFGVWSTGAVEASRVGSSPASVARGSGLVSSTPPSGDDSLGVAQLVERRP